MQHIRKFDLMRNGLILGPMIGFMVVSVVQAGLEGGELLNAGLRDATAEAFMGWLKPGAIRPREKVRDAAVTAVPARCSSWIEAMPVPKSPASTRLPNSVHRICTTAMLRLR